MLAAVQRAADLFAQAGAVVEPMAPFLTREMLDGMDHFWRMRSHVDMNALPPERKAKVLPDIQAWADSAHGMSGESGSRAQHQFYFTRLATVKACAAFDYVISPTSPVPAFAAGMGRPPPTTRCARRTHRLYGAVQHVGATRGVHQLRLHHRRPADRAADCGPAL